MENTTRIESLELYTFVNDSQEEHILNVFDMELCKDGIDTYHFVIKADWDTDTGNLYAWFKNGELVDTMYKWYAEKDNIAYNVVEILKTENVTKEELVKALKELDNDEKDMWLDYLEDVD